MNTPSDNGPSLIANGPISSATTPFLKWFPIIWTGLTLLVGSFGVGFALKYTNPFATPEIGWNFIVLIGAILVLLGMGLAITRLFAQCVDEVVLSGSRLFVRNGHQRTEIERDQILSMDYWKWSNPPIVTLKVRPVSEDSVGYAQVSKNALYSDQSDATNGEGSRTLKFFGPMGVSGFHPSPKIEALRQWILAR